MKMLQERFLREWSAGVRHWCEHIAPLLASAQTGRNQKTTGATT